MKVELNIRCPRIGENVQTPPMDGKQYWLALGEDQKPETKNHPLGHLIAVITIGHPKFDEETIICSVERCKSALDAAKWFGKQLITRPWEPRS